MIEYIIIIILVVILFLSIKKTNFNHFQTANEARECKYVPWGPNFDFCSENCQSQNRLGLWDNSGNSCSQDICDAKCLACDNIEMCEWLDVVKLQQKKKLDALTLKSDTKVNKLVPNKPQCPKPCGISYGNKVTLTWKNSNDADKYIIHYYDLTQYSNKINVIQVQKETDQETITKDIDTLEPNKNYNFLIYAVNRYGISDASNNINLKT